MSLIQRRMLLLLCLIPFLSLSGPKVAQAQGPLILTERQGEYKVGKYLTYLEDPSGNLTIEDVTSPKYAPQFRQRNEEVPNFGFTNSAYWMRFEVRNQARPTTLWLLELAFGNFHQLDLYFPSPDQHGFSVKQMGNLLPFNSSEFAYHNPVFKLPLLPNQTTTIYLRAKNGSVTFFPLTLWTLETFAQKQAETNLGWGIFYGVLLIVLVYNFLMFISLRDKAYFCLINFGFSFLLTHAAIHGFTAQYFWPTVGGWDCVAMNLLTGISLANGLQFIIVALETKTYLPRPHKVATFFKWLTWFLVGCIPFGSYDVLAKLLSGLIILACFLGISICFLTLRRGYHPAHYFTLGLASIMFSEVFFHFSQFEILPITFLVEMSLEIGTVIGMFFFSLTLIDRVNTLHQEKQQAQNKEALLREREELFRSMFETHSAVMLLISPESGQIVEANQAAERYYGYPLEELKNLSIYQINQLQCTEVQHEMTHAKAEKRNFFLFTHRLANGEIRTVEVYSTPIKYRKQTLLFSIVHDVTERKQAEEALRESEIKFKVMSTSAQDAIIMMDHQGAISFWNEAASRIFGYSSEEVLGQHLHKLLAPASYLTIYQRHVEQFWASEEGNMVGKTLELEALHKRGETFPIEISMSALQIKRQCHALGIVRDITARKQFEKQLQEANNRFRTELAFARKIQQNLLQPPYPAWPGLKVLCFNAPAREVSGDFYDYLTFTSNSGEPKYTFAVGDVTGKGMPAALLMAVSIALLRSVAHLELSPSLLLTNLDQQLESYTKEDLMNCALCYIEITLPTTENARGRVRIANGGLIPPFLKPCEGQTNLISVAGPPLGAGLGEILGYPEKTIDLAPGEMLILTSDGLVEATNSQGELLGFERTLAMIQAGPTDAEAMLAYLQTEILTFMDGSEPHDDITIVVVQL